jgi:hypothetical protein
MGERRGVHKVLVGKPEGKNHLEGPGVDRRIILKQIFRTWARGIGWINLPRNRDGWLAFVNTVMNLPVTQNAENVLTSRELLDAVSALSVSTAAQNPQPLCNALPV